MYMLGSLVCALAPNMVVLILGRVLHGLGGGGLTSTGMVVLGDIAAPKERGKYYGYFSAIYTTAGACGPVLGGAIAEYLHWSVIFWMNIPLGLHRDGADADAAAPAAAARAAAPARFPRRGADHDRKRRVHAGAQHGRRELSLDVAADPCAVRGRRWSVGAGFVVRLLTAPEPLIPLSILSDREARLAIVANAFGWGPIVGLHIFLPIYLQNIVGMAPASRRPERADARGHAQRQRRRHRHHPAAARALQAHSRSSACCSRSPRCWRWPGRRPTFSFGNSRSLLLLIGAGFGCMPPLAATALQNNVSIHTFGSAVATMQFSRNLYATMIVAVFGVLVLAAASDTLAGSRPAIFGRRLCPRVLRGGGELCGLACCHAAAG